MNNGLQCYKATDLYETFKRAGRAQEWSNWIVGQTGVMNKKGKLLTYKTDVDRFLRGGNSFRL